MSFTLLENKFVFAKAVDKSEFLNWKGKVNEAVYVVDFYASKMSVEL